MVNELYLLVIIVALLFAMLAQMLRNSNTCYVRIFFISEHSDKYESLPSYEAMLYNPRYYHLWTKAQWLAWVNKQESKK